MSISGRITRVTRRQDRRKAARACAAQEPEQHGLRLIVARVADRDPVGALPCPRALEKLVAHWHGPSARSIRRAARPRATRRSVRRRTADEGWRRAPRRTPDRDPIRRRATGDRDARHPPASAPRPSTAPPAGGRAPPSRRRRTRRQRSARADRTSAGAE